MPKVIINGVHGLDGEYELDLVFTHRDFRTIKQVASVRANEVMEALNAGDLDIVVAIAEIALQRAGVEHSVDQLWDAEAGSLTLALDEEADVSPPPPSDDESRSDSAPTSGVATNGATEPSPETSPPSVSGTPLRVAT